MITLEDAKKLAFEAGMSACGTCDISTLRFHPEIREICEKSCRGFGRTWACPPGVGTIEECRARCEQYGTFLLFSKVFELEDSLDFEGMGDAMHSFKDNVEAFDEKLRAVLSDYLLLGNEGCNRCKECTYPDAPCRFPEKFHQAIESYGFVVNELAVEADIPYNNGPDTVTFFGAVLF